MNNADANLAVVELAAIALEPLLDELTLVGGCAVGLLITDQTRPPVRATVDVDLLAEITTLGNYYRLGERLKELGFIEGDHPICRFIKNGLIVDVMPTEQGVLGFGNQWYEQAAKRASRLTLPSGRCIRHVTAPYLLGTKLEAFHGRGNGDYMHHDVEDIINLIDGRPSVVDEVLEEDGPLKIYLQDQFDELLSDPSFTEAIPAHFHPSEDIRHRLPIILERMRRLAGL